MSSKLAFLFSDCERSLSAVARSHLEPLRGGHLFITGGTGFVGLWISVFVAYLNDQHNFGLRVSAIARRDHRSKGVAEALLSRPDYEFRTADVRQLVELPASAQWIVHAAGSPDSREHATNPMGVMSTIAEGTERVLRLAEQAVNLTSVLHFSSASVYAATGAGTVFSEDAAGRLDASAAYSEAKRYSEVLCASSRSQSRLPVTITRPFTFLGPFQSLDAPWAANNFLYAAMNGQPLKVLGDGETTRTFLYGSDMAALALCQLAARSSGVYNLGSTEPISLRNLAERIASKVSARPDIRYNSAGRQVPRSALTPDMSRSIDQFDFKPAFDISEAVSRTCEWHVGASRL